MPRACRGAQATAIYEGIWLGLLSRSPPYFLLNSFKPIQQTKEPYRLYVELKTEVSLDKLETNYFVIRGISSVG